MRSNLIYGGFLVICLLVLIVKAQNQEVEDGINKQSPAQSARSRFVLPKIFDFGLFKRLFKKHYQSLVQELARQKLFLARAFEAFVSAVKYKYSKLDYYLGINKMSDQTPEELAKRKNKRLANGNGFGNPEKNSTQTIEVLDEEDVERELARIVEQQSGEPGLKEAAEEISKSTLINFRRKRNVDTRDISLDDLLPNQQNVPSNNKKIVRSVPSNNPNYEPLELISYGAEDENGHDDEISENELSFINSFPASGFISSMKNKLTSAFSDSLKQQQESPEDSNFIVAQSKKPKELKEDVVYIDHRSSNCFTEPRDQGVCGSCYIFSSISLFEYAHCKQTGKLVAFSEQYAIDCGFRFGLGGCQGDFEKNFAKFVKKYGLELLSKYPYRGKEGTCPYPKDTNPKTMGWLRVKDAATKEIGERIFERFLKEGPMLVHAYAPPDFTQYKGGVHSGKKCDLDGTHSMLLIGHGKEDGKDYWLFRNSYGSDWGEGGYFKLNKKSECFKGEWGGWALSTGFENLTKENPYYKSFKLTKKHATQRDPDAPPETEITGVVNDG